MECNNCQKLVAQNANNECEHITFGTTLVVKLKLENLTTLKIVTCTLFLIRMSSTIRQCKVGNFVVPTQEQDDDHVGTFHQNYMI